MRFNPTPLALLLAIPVASAQTEPVSLGTVSITAKGYASEDLDTPIATTVLEREELLRRNAHNPGEALRGEPGLAVASDGAQGQNPVIRGLKKESVVLLVDGMRLNSAQPQGAIASFMSLGLADRIEAVKGPASVLYGTGALGGAINVRLPQARFEAGSRAEAAASHDTASGGTRGTGLVNVSQGDHAVMAGASVARIGDYQSPDGRVERTGYDSESFIGQYRFRLDGAQQLRFSLQQHKDTDVWYPGSKKAHPLQPAVIGNTIIRSPSQQRRLAEAGYSRQGSGDRPVNVDVRLYQQQMERYIWTYSDKQDAEKGKTKVTFGTVGVDAKADWLLHPQHLLSFGANAWRMTATPERYLANPPAGSPLNPNDPFSDGRIQALGLYVQDDMRFGKLNVLAGLRHDTVQGSAGSMANPAGAGAAVTSGLDRRDSAFSGSLGAIYEAAPLLRPYASLSRGFRAGEMRERYESSPRADGYFYRGNPQIRPETAVQLEVGLKGAAPDLNYAVSVYRNTISNYITGQPTGTLTQGLQTKETVNLGKAVIEGMEASVRWQVRSGQWLKAGYSRLRGENRDLGEALFQMPADELGLGWEGALTSGWTADAMVRLVQRQDRVATTFSLGSENATPGFATLDLGATWRYARGQSLRVALKNLADKAYHEHLAEGVSGQEIRAPGRSLQAIWRGSF